jgi:molybdenum cofactor cytidylyltransferase
MPKTSSVSIPAILLGGREVRHLRVPKQILPFGDVTVLGRTLRAYLDAGVSDVILVLGYKADLIASQLGPLPPNVRIVKNPLFDEGMGTFLRLGVREIPAGSQGFCIGLGDQPLLLPELIRELQAAFIEGKKKILVPTHQMSLGLPAFFEPSIADEILALPPQGELWDIIKRHGDELIDYETGYTAIIRSIEDQDDYHAMLKIAGLPIPDPVPVSASDDSASAPPDEASAV